ncbi:glycosyltransferase [Lunatimonas lonarensis]|uniref:Glycosyltransferase n=1 Tax=Lunatimonas lonarensis TaxID=1232681 RepID=R7ZZ37_9BACT|nr:glycosyltransferase family 1 protein [Lunatimonas lonarensis]EON79350.1 glycosyltransferase [Lunatimonas lonarensis]
MPPNPLIWYVLFPHLAEMAETKKIILASVLKPVDDPRMMYKMGFSMRETNKYRLYILGFPPKNPSIFPEITVSTLFDRRRTHPSRLLAGFRLLRHILTIRPQIVIVTTYELLPALIVAKWLHTFKAVYDVQEDYSQNILFNKTMPTLVRKPAASFVKSIEYIATPWIDWYLLAEQCYRATIPKPERSTLLENKYQGKIIPKGPLMVSRAKGIHFVIVGTLSEVFGVLDAVKWFKNLVQAEPQHTLEIRGHCPLASLRKRLLELTGDCPQITLDASPVPVTHRLFDHAVDKAGAWLMPYQLTDSIRDKMPTKLFDAMARGIPVLITPNPLWEDFISRYPGGIGVDFTDRSEPQRVVEKLAQTSFFKQAPGTEVSWDSEKDKLIHVIEELSKV